ncbi:hypothetical protein SARC_14484 [Sphaeroforma arctica JP610]|uniref:Succinate dehydrogenase cytochrome b560 subunit, mitochondrial n=1 Tax=Sphaeroforma arctica JP610 TaxID=667725 RepID=A0A0L0F8S5_9EUKA|nr:hypothetical protein SARC_14484 [Sphaeroforma arctica JP610]KNC72956.1 hypothetical protein SARC_14484 [Sphaeroforma arctica JP610]|eukprot:XP_014146858.1 hypothetical protein SARC_14484 [Sphaeroforma arctica JP610]
MSAPMCCPSPAMATFGIGTMVAGKPFAEILEDIKKLEIPPACFYATKFVLAWPFVYHTVNGVRHMVWDRALALTIPGVYNTGYAAVAVSTTIAGLITTL